MIQLRFLALYFAAWIPAAALYSFLIYRATPAAVRSASGAAVGGFESMLFAALLGLGVWAGTRRLGERNRSLLVMAAVHAGMAVAYTLTWNAIILASIYFTAPRQIFASYVQFGLAWQLLTGLLIYGMVAGIAHALTVTRRLRREREATVRAEALRARAELSALRAQMNPHFLFNTLHSISALARTDPGAVEDALERLAGLLRRLLDPARLGAEQVPLSDEWEIVRDQLELEKLRFGDRLILHQDADPEALDCLIPVLTLQPLVENAIKHGVAARTKPCTVYISARVVQQTHGDGEELVLEVRDDGPGAEQRAALDATGLGLRSVRQRLLAMYGDRAGTRVETEPGGGFSVRVSLPAIVAPVASSNEPEPR